jgi:hypothetical protein
MADTRDLQAAAEAAANAAPPPSITDLAPGPATTIAGRPAAFVCAAVLRIFECVKVAVERRDGVPMSDDDAGYLLVYLRLRAKDEQEQMALWQAARKPLTLYSGYVSWMFATPLAEFLPAARESMEAVAEINRVAAIVNGGDDENPTATAGATGSP